MCLDNKECYIPCNIHFNELRFFLTEIMLNMPTNDDEFSLFFLSMLNWFDCYWIKKGNYVDNHHIVFIECPIVFMNDLILDQRLWHQGIYFWWELKFIKYIILTSTYQYYECYQHNSLFKYLNIFINSR